MKKNRIAITGNEGFLGKHLTDSLRNKKNIELILLDRNKMSLFNPKTLGSFLKGVGVVIHLAGANRDSDFNLIKTNLLGTVGLLEAIAKYSPKAKIIFSSSFQVYDEKSAYGLSKKLAEDAIESFSRIYKIRSIILRISNIYGKGGKPFYNSVIATFAYLIKNKKPIIINGTGEQKRDYIYVEDAVNAIVKAIDHSPSSACEYFDICSGRRTSINDIIDILKTKIAYKINITYNKGVEEGGEPVLKKYTKAEEALNWHPEVDIEKGLVLTINGK